MLSRRSVCDMSSQQWRPKVRQELITVLTTSPARWVSACKRQSTIAITAVCGQNLCGAFIRLYWQPTSKTAIDSRQWRPTVWQKRLYLCHQGELQHNYFDFVSLHHSDHNSVVRIFVGHSEVVKRLLFRLFRGATALLVAAMQPVATRWVVIYSLCGNETLKVEESAQAIMELKGRQKHSQLDYQDEFQQQNCTVG